MDEGKGRGDRFGQDRATGIVPLPSRFPETGEEDHLVTVRVLQGDVVRLLAGFFLAPLLPAVGWNQAAPVGERGAKVRAGCGLLGADVDRLGRILFRPGSTETPVGEGQGY